jgi:hypothetical protein
MWAPNLRENVRRKHHADEEKGKEESEEALRSREAQSLAIGPEENSRRIKRSSFFISFNTNSKPNSNRRGR